MITIDKMVGKKTSYAKPSCSSLPYIKGISQYQTQNEWLDVAINASEGKLPEHKEQTLTQYMGDLLEPVLCNFAAELLGLSFVKTDHEEPVHHQYLPLSGSLDASGVADNLTFKQGDNENIIIPEQKKITLDGPGVIECKCTRNPFTPELEEWRGVLQSKGLMECTGWNWAAVVVLWQSTDFRIYLYERKEPFKKELEELVLDCDYRIKNKKYYNPVSSNDANIKYQNINKDIVSLEHEADNLCRTIMNAKDSIKLAQETVDKAEIKLKELIQDAEIGRTNQYEIKWPMINYKAQPEKIVPAKDARQVRAKTLRIKKYE